MRLEDAIKVSSVEIALDGRKELSLPGAKVTFDNGTKLIISRGWDDFFIAHADTMNPISRNPNLLIHSFHDILAGRTDWEPV